MEFSIRELAAKKLARPEIFNGREKLSTSEVIDNYGGKIAIDEIDFVSLPPKDGQERNDVWVYHIHGTQFFAFAGTVLSDVFMEYVKYFEGDYTAAIKAFNEEAKTNPLSVRLFRSKSKNGATYTNVEVLAK